MENPFQNLYFSIRHRHLAISLGEKFQLSRSQIISILLELSKILSFILQNSLKYPSILFLSIMISYLIWEIFISFSQESCSSFTMSFLHCSTQDPIAPKLTKFGSKRSVSYCAVFKMYFCKSVIMISESSLKQQFITFILSFPTAPWRILSMLYSSMKLFSSILFCFTQLSIFQQCLCLFTKKPLTYIQHIKYNMIGIVVFNKSLFAHFVDFLQGVNLLLKLKYSIFHHLDVQLIFPLFTSFTNQINPNFRTLFLPYPSCGLWTLTLIIFFNILKVIVLRFLHNGRIGSRRRLNFRIILKIVEQLMKI